MATKTLRYFVGPANAEGEVPIVYLHSDKIDMAKFGKREAPRVSDVEFDTFTQEWVARLKDGTEIFRDKNRENLVQREGEVLAERFAAGLAIPGGFIMEEFVDPQFENDCSCCRFLGVHNEHDLYWCGITQNVLIKFGDHHDHMFSPADEQDLTLKQRKVLEIARERATRKGLPNGRNR